MADDHLRIRRRLLAGLAADIAALVHGGGRVVLVSRAAPSPAASTSWASRSGRTRCRPCRRPPPSARAASSPTTSASSATMSSPPRRCCSPARTSPAAPATSTRATRCAGCSRGASCRWSTRTTRRRPTRSASATTTCSPRRWPSCCAPTCSCCSPTRTGLYTTDPRKHQRRRTGAPSHRPGAARGARRRRRVAPRRRRHARQDGGRAHGRGRQRAHGHRQRLPARRARRGGRGARTSGTQVLARATSASAFKLWLRYAKPVRGTLEVDAGAARALAQGGSSLLPVGVKAIHGSFVAGDAVAIVGPRRRRGRPGSRPR